MAFRHLARTSLVVTGLAVAALTGSAAGVAAGEVTVGSNYSDEVAQGRVPGGPGLLRDRDG